MKKLFYVLSIFLLSTNESSFARPPLEDLENALKGSPRCLEIAREAVKDEFVYSEEPFEWPKHFSFKDPDQKKEAELFHKVVGDYFTLWVKDVFDKKRALVQEDIEWKILQDDYRILTSYKDSIIEVYPVLLSEEEFS